MKRHNNLTGAALLAAILLAAPLAGCGDDNNSVTGPEPIDPGPPPPINVVDGGGDSDGGNQGDKDRPEQPDLDHGNGE